MPLDIATQCPDQPRSWNVTIDEYLDNNGVDCKKATPLQSGASAYVWRLDSFKGGSSAGDGQRGQTCVMKCGDSTIKAIPDFEVPAERMDVEIKAMGSRVVAQACRQEPSVEVSRVLRKTDKGFIMAWAGDMDLRTAYKNDQSLDARGVGTRLGKWIACLHLAGKPNNEIWDSSNALVETMCSPEGLETTNLRSEMEKQGFDERQIDRAITVLHKSSSFRTLTPWDFRPMNTLLRLKENSPPDLTVVDWEACHYGDPAYDIRMWAAEAMVLESKYGSDRGLLSSFLTAYKQRAGKQIVTTEFVCKVAVAVGALLLLIMPADIWYCTEEDREPWKNIALEYVQAGANGDMDWLRKSSLKPLLAG